MKKKFFIPGIIAGLFFIGSFCSAWESKIYCDKDTSGCSVNNLEACCPVPRLTSFTCTSVGDILVLRLSSDGQSIGGANFSCPGVYTTSNPSRLIVGYGSQNGNTSGFYISESDTLPVSELSPVITGLNNTVNEFIPYIAFIGIGVLSALIGFVAIRRLINRLRNKTLSPFK